MHHFNTPAARAYAHAGEARRAFVRARALVNLARYWRARGDAAKCIHAAQTARMVVRAGRQFEGYALEHGVAVPR